MDIVVNGKSKMNNVKGYLAYFNTLMAIGFAKYLKENAAYVPGLVIADSPILSLKEREKVRTSESMRSALFEYIVNNIDGLQVIIAENEIPNIDYKDANVIKFTKEIGNGRYGFLCDIVDE